MADQPEVKKDSDMVFMVHPDLPDTPPGQIPYGAFRDGWSQMGWELATEDQVEAAGKTVVDEENAAFVAALENQVVPEVDEYSGKKEK